MQVSVDHHIRQADDGVEAPHAVHFDQIYEMRGIGEPCRLGPDGKRLKKL
jgi:hypothetical protein